MVQFSGGQSKYSFSKLSFAIGFAFIFHSMVPFSVLMKHFIFNNKGKRRKKEKKEKKMQMEIREPSGVEHKRGKEP